jgi:hypothetical protein
VGAGLYGGGSAPNDADNSGTMRFVSIRYTGYRINDEQELNGLTFAGVGSGGTFEYIHVHNGNDDGIEFFGGDPRLKFIVLSGSSDDGFDWTQGFRGKAQFVLVIQGTKTEASADPRGIEADNLDVDHDALPRSAPQLANFTLVGPGASSTYPGDVGVLFRRGTAGTFVNFVVSAWKKASLDLDDAATYSQATGGTLQMKSWLLGDKSGGGPFAADSDDGPLAGIFNGGANNEVATPTLSGYFNGTEEKSVTAVDPSTVDPWFTSVDFIGALNTNN